MNPSPIRASEAPTPSPSSTSLQDRVRSLRLPDQPAGGGGSGKLPWALCFLLTLVCLYLGYAAYGPEAVTTDEADSPDSAAVATAPSSEASQASASAGAVVLESKGYVIPVHKILVTPQVSGRILKLQIEEGFKVNKGDILAEIESTEYQADYDRASATLARSRQQLLELENGARPEEIQQAEKESEETEADLAQWRSQHERNQGLMRQNLLTPQDYEQTEARFRSTERKLERLAYRLKLLRKGPREEVIESARADVRLIEADLVKAKWRLDNCVIYAPISGTILRKNAEQGNIVNPIAFSGSQSLCEMADLANLEIELNIQERDVSQVFKNQKCAVRAEAFSNRSYDGSVSRLMPIADRAKGAIPVRVRVTVPAEEEGVYLKPEMGAVVTFYNESVQPSATLQLSESKEAHVQ